MLRDFLAALSGLRVEEHFDKEKCSLTVSVVGPYSAIDTTYTFQNNTITGRVVVSNDSGGGYEEVITDIPYDVRLTHFLYRIGLKKERTHTP